MTDAPRKPRRSQSSGGIHFGDHATVGGDVFTGDKTVNMQSTGVDSQALLALLQQLQAALQAAPLSPSDREQVESKVTTAIQEVKDTKKPTPSKLENIKTCVSDTKTILERVKDIGEIGKYALPILLQIGGLIGLKFL